jgi:hypothetical protein
MTMTSVELPRPLEAYFAHAELQADGDGRRFTITLPYFDRARLDRLQWWWSISNAQLRIGGEAGVTHARQQATARFRQHVEHWLASNGLRLTGPEPIPRLLAANALEPAGEESQDPLTLLGRRA